MVAWLKLTAFHHNWTKQHKHVFYAFPLRNTVNLNQGKPNYHYYTHNTNWHCHVHFYAYVGQPLLKELYVKSDSRSETKNND